MVNHSDNTQELLEALGGESSPTSDTFKKLVTSIDSHHILAKVFLLEGTPHVFESSPMKYVIFREQVAERFGVGSQDVCIVGSAMLGFSPSPHKYGRKFEETSDVDVVIISEPLYYEGSQELFAHINTLHPSVHVTRDYINHPQGKSKPEVKPDDWRSVKEAVRNFTFQNFNPSLLPYESKLRTEIFDKISSTAGLFLALEPKVFVSKIRCRIFRTWKAAEGYYSNSLRQLSISLKDQAAEIEVDDEDGEDVEAQNGGKGVA